MMTYENRWLTDKWWLSPYNWVDEIRKQFTLPEKVYIHDVTLREAMQSPRVCLRPEEKIRIARALDKLGVDSIENGAYMSELEKEVTKELVKMQRRGEIKTKVTPLAHWTEQDVDIALETGADRVLISQTVNPWMVKVFYNMDEKEITEKLTKVISYAKSNKLFVIAQVYDTYRASLEFLERMIKTIVFEGGADNVAISDTRGFALPWTATYLVRKVKSWIPQTPIEHHGHNDYGLVTALMAGAVVGGAEVVHTSINGIGERVGNAATEEVAMVLELLLGVKTAIHLEQIHSTCQLVAELTKHPIARNKPIVGENMFLSGSGQVVWRHWKLSQTDRPFADIAFDPQVIGRGGEMLEVILGVGCGKTIVKDRLQKMGIRASEEQIGEIVQRVKEEAHILKWSLTDAHFEEIVKNVLEK
jgi:isopropylmalate/homocitrate/citramalate synthase